MKWLCLDGAPQVLRGILVYFLFLGVLSHDWNSDMTLLVNISLLCVVSCAFVGVACNFFAIVSGVITTLGSVILLFWVYFHP